MEANIVKNEIVQCRTIYDATNEIGLESDIVLPDYCRDIERILRCTLSPRISSKQVDASRLSVSGTAFMRLIYANPEGEISSFETQIPFSKNIDVQGADSGCTAEVSLRCEYVNCRAVSQRRFEVRAALSAKSLVRCRQNTELAGDIDGNGIEVRKQNIQIIVPVAFVCEPFTVMDEYETAGEIKSVVRMSAVPEITDTKVISGKVIIKGEIPLNIAYIGADSDEIKNVSYLIPVSQVISAQGTQEGDELKAHLEVSRMSAEPIQRRDVNELAVEVMLEVCAEVSRKDEVTVVTDAYSTDFETEASYIHPALVSMDETVSKKYTLNVAPEGECGEVLDVFTELKNTSASVNEQGEMMISGDLTVAFLCRNAQGELSINEKTVKAEFSAAADKRFADARCDCEAFVASANLAPGNREAQITIAADCRACKSDEINAIEDFRILTDKPKDKNGKTALTVYFADPGENIFDIARRYNTSAKAVMEENALENTCISAPMAILIPMM